MILLHSNLSLQNLTSEEFSVEKNTNYYGSTINKVDLLEANDRIVYDNFVNMIGLANVSITDIPSDTEDMFCFSRHFKFEHDSNFNIIGLSSYAKSYADFNISEKSVIDSFLQMISALSN